MGDDRRSDPDGTGAALVAADLVVVAGAPGSGKSTLCLAIRQRLGGVPFIEFSSLRQWHLDSAWSDQSPQEGCSYLIITLYLDDDVLAERVSKREAGFRAVEMAVAWNAATRTRDPLPGEVKIDASRLSPPELMELVVNQYGS